MIDCAAVEELGDSEGDDPRLSAPFIRCISGTGGEGTVLIVGVVHDHPASLYRVAAVLEQFTPDHLALELPPLAMPLFRLYASDDHSPPRLGGEMSMALQVASAVPSRGIDAPNATYFQLLATRFRTGQLPMDLLVPTLRDMLSAATHALVCRFGAIVGSLLRFQFPLYSHIRYDCTLLDDPETQAEHEVDHLARQRTFLGAIDIPRARQLIDSLRNETMALQLQHLRSQGDVVAIVGMEHLDPLLERLEKAP